MDDKAKMMLEPMSTDAKEKGCCSPAVISTDAGAREGRKGRGRPDDLLRSGKWYIPPQTNRRIGADSTFTDWNGTILGPAGVYFPPLLPM